MTSISKNVKNVYNYNLDDIVNIYNNKYHCTFKMKPIDVKANTYINSVKEIHNEDPKFKIGSNIVTISRLKNIFAKDQLANWSQEVFIIKKAKNTVSWIYAIIDLKGKEIVGTFYEKELQKTNRKEFTVEKLIKGKGDKLYVKWKGYDNLFNSWIDQKMV